MLTPRTGQTGSASPPGSRKGVQLRHTGKRLDQLDFDLILELQQDSRQSNAKLAKQLGVSEATVRRRVRRLVQEQFIKITAVPDPFKVGFDTVAFMGLRVQLAKLDGVAAALAAKPCVHYVGLATGRYDIIIWVILPSAGDLAKFLKEEVAMIDGIVSTETMMNLEIRKRSFGWLCQLPGDRHGKAGRSRRAGEHPGLSSSLGESLEASKPL